MLVPGRGSATSPMVTGSPVTGCADWPSHTNTSDDKGGDCADEGEGEDEEDDDEDEDEDDDDDDDDDGSVDDSGGAFSKCGLGSGCEICALSSIRSPFTGSARSPPAPPFISFFTAPFASAFASFFVSSFVPSFVPSLVSAFIASSASFKVPSVVVVVVSMRCIRKEAVWFHMKP